MVTISGIPYLGCKIQIADESPDNNPHLMSISVHFFADPEMFDLKTWKKVPFCTITADVFDEKNATMITALAKDGDSQRFTSEKMYLIVAYLSKLSETGTDIYNMYTDEEYYHIRDKYDQTIPFPSTIIHVGTGHLEEDKLRMPMIIVGAVPILGTMAPVTKSPNYELYNGKFIHCKAFCSPKRDVLYNGIAYIYGKINTHVEIVQYRKGTISEMWGNNVVTEWRVTRSNTGMPIIHEETTASLVWYPGNESLFQKPKRNLFHLSDVPKGVTSKDATIRTTLKS